MNTTQVEQRRNRVATETSASDGWIARLRERLPPTEATPAPRQTNLPLRPRVSPAKPPAKP